MNFICSLKKLKITLNNIRTIKYSLFSNIIKIQT